MRFYGRAKLIGFVKYIGISLYIRNIGIFQMKIIKNAKIWGSTDAKNTKFGIPDLWMDVPKRTVGFLEIFIFWRKMGSWTWKNGGKWLKMAKIELWTLIFLQKIKIFKNPTVRFYKTIHRWYIPVFGLPSALDVQIFELLFKIWNAKKIEK